MSATLSLTDSTFEEIVLKSKKLVLVDFWADWCSPCKKFLPILEALANDKEMEEKIIIAKIDIQANPHTPAQYYIQSIPTIILFKDGKKLDKHVGVPELEELKKFVKKHIT